MTLSLKKRLRVHAATFENEWLFPNRFRNGPINEATLYAAWKRIKKAAGVEETLRAFTTSATEGRRT